MGVMCFKERAGCPGGGKGILIQHEKSFTCSTLVDEAICYEDIMGENNIVINNSGNGISSPIDSNYYKGAGSRGVVEREYIAVQNSEGEKYVVRRFTPLECCRLQGFPDWWCDNVEGTDTDKYRMWGNGVALPCVCDVIGRLAKELEKEG